MVKLLNNERGGKKTSLVFYLLLKQFLAFEADDNGSIFTVLFIHNYTSKYFLKCCATVTFSILAT